MKSIIITTVSALFLLGCSSIDSGKNSTTNTQTFENKLSKVDKNKECLSLEEDIREIIRNENKGWLSAGGYSLEKVFYSPLVDSCVYYVKDLNGDGFTRGCWIKDAFSNEIYEYDGAGNSKDDEEDCWNNDYVHCEVVCGDLYSKYYFGNDS
jgi:hypothetical protein